MERSGLRSGFFVRVIGLAAGLVAVACSEQPSTVAPSVGVPVRQSLANGGPGLPLIPVVGTGAGSFNLVHTESNRDGFTSDAQLTVSVHGVTPNTVLYVRRAGDLGLAGGQQTDGICQRADAGLFGALPAPDGTPVTLETSPGGSGTTTFISMA
jgi:hypothetical protein